MTRAGSGNGGSELTEVATVTGHEDCCARCKTAGVQTAHPHREKVLGWLPAILVWLGVAVLLGMESRFDD